MADEKLEAAAQGEAPPPPVPAADGEAPPAPVDQPAPPRDAIALQPPPAAAVPPGSPPPSLEPSRPEPKKEAKSSEPKDVLREIAETVVFVVVLVLLLKTFIAEAFVIPTGSMATTLWGYQKVVTCEQCGHIFPVNCSSQVDPQSPSRQDVEGCTCPNCLLRITFPDPKKDPQWNSGDRVLVFKAWFDGGLPGGQAKRHDVVVFKYPVEPQKDNQAMNYIKRLIGLPGETIAIQGGQLYVLEGPRPNPPPPPQQDGQPYYWSYHYNWPEDKEARTLLAAGKFTIVRKPPLKMLALRRIVYDNDHPARDLAGPDKARWQAEDGWKPDNPNLPRSFSRAADAGLSWLRYRHLLRGQDKPELIRDIMGYNTGRPPLRDTGNHWVGDLMLEGDVQVDQVQKQPELRLELSRGADRFQARFDLATGQCKLVRQPKGAAEQELAVAETTLKGPGRHHLIFANFDDRLTLWVDDTLPFGDGVAYPPPPDRGPDPDNDLQPAGIAASGTSLSVAKIQLWRDTYYTIGHGDTPDGIDWKDPSTWGPLHKPEAKTFYIYPGHYLCLGDNSPESSDGRLWGMVPERLMLGRALLVYFPFQFPGWLPANRVGPIH